MIERDDEELDKELTAYKVLAAEMKARKAPKPVKEQADKMVDFLTELKSWRSTGRKMLESLKTTKS